MKILKMLHAHIIMFHFFSYIIICICKPYHGQILANSGESVTLKCDLEKSAGTLCSWVKDGFLVDTFSRRYELKVIYVICNICLVIKIIDRNIAVLNMFYS